MEFDVIRCNVMSFVTIFSYIDPELCQFLLITMCQGVTQLQLQLR